MRVASWAMISPALRVGNVKLCIMSLLMARNIARRAARSKRKNTRQPVRNPRHRRQNGWRRCRTVNDANRTEIGSFCFADSLGKGRANPHKLAGQKNARREKFARWRFACETPLDSENGQAQASVTATSSRTAL